MKQHNKTNSQCSPFSNRYSGYCAWRGASNMPAMRILKLLNGLEQDIPSSGSASTSI